LVRLKRNFCTQYYVDLSREPAFYILPKNASAAARKCYLDLACMGCGLHLPFKTLILK
jgi:hypothetical protein